MKKNGAGEQLQSSLNKSEIKGAGRGVYRIPGLEGEDKPIPTVVLFF
jgi:hypothetical protein